MKTSSLMTIVLAAVLLMGWAGESRAGTGAESNAITFTTARKVGETIKLTINADAADRAGVWIDLNNNGKQDAGEAVSRFGNYATTEFTLGAQTISIYGKVTELDCSGNDLTALDLSQSPALTVLGCHDNQIAALDVSGNPELTVLKCDWNQLTVLDLSHNPKLTELHCRHNQLTALDLSKNPELTELICFQNWLTALDVSKNPELTVLGCSRNPLATLDLSRNPKLTELICSMIDLTTLDLSKNPELTVLTCQNTGLTSLDLSGNPKLTELYCSNSPYFSTKLGYSNNQFTTLDLSGNPELTRLDCSWTGLTALKVSKNTKLTELDCRENKITGEHMTTLVKSLPDRTGKEAGYFWVIDPASPHEQNEITEAQQAIAEKKNWDCVDVPLRSENAITLTTSKAVGEEIRLAASADEADRDDVWIDLNNNGFREEGEYFRNLDRKSSGRETYVVSSQTITVYGKVTMLACSDSEITSLVVRKGEKLKELWCGKNKLTSLDLTEALALMVLWCKENQLTEEAISNIVADLPAREPSDYAKAYFDDNIGKVTIQDSESAAAKNWQVSPIKLSSKAQAEYDALLNEWEPFLGGWCCNDETVNEGECFRLDFELSDKESMIIDSPGGPLSIRYYLGGPFEENFSGKVVSENHVELYFISIGGSISFNRMMEGEDMEKCRGKKVADCVLQSDGTIKITVGHDGCGYMYGTHTLRKLKKDETCRLRY